MIEMRETWREGHLTAVSVEGKEKSYYEVCEQLYAQMVGWA